MTDRDPDFDPLPMDDRVRLVELVDRVLDRGVVLRGDVTISVAGIDLVYLELRLLLSGIEALNARALAAGERDRIAERGQADEGREPDEGGPVDEGGPADV